ncbi:MAG: lipid II flippase MurJ [Lautropia sp.]
MPDGTASAAPPRGDGRRALRSLSWLLLFAVLSKGAGFFKEMALAHRFGIAAITDAYALGFAWAIWLPGIFASIALAVVVPALATLRTRPEAERRQFVAELIGLTLTAGVVAGILTALVPLLRLAGVPLDDSLAQTLPLLAWLVPASFITALATALLVAEHRHSNLALEGLPSALLIVALLLPARIDLATLCLVTAAGYGVYAVAVLLQLRATGQSLMPRFGFGAPAWRVLATASAAVLIGNACAGSLMLADQSQAAALGAGAAATLAFSSRLLQLPAVLLSTLISRATLPVFAQMQAEGRDTRPLVLRASLIAGAVGAAGALIVWLAAEPLVALAFQRGQFTARDVAVTAGALRWGILQLPAFLASIVLVQALLARRRFAAVAASGIFNLVAKIGANAWLAPRMGVDGIALATSLVLTASFGILLAAYLRRPEGAT